MGYINSRGVNLNRLSLQLNKSILVQGYSSGTTDAFVASSFLRENTSVIMILHVLPGTCYIPIQCISTIASEREILLEDNLFYTLRGTIDCTNCTCINNHDLLFENSKIIVLVDVSKHMLEKFDIDGPYYEPTTSFCFRVPPNVISDFEKRLHSSELDRLDTQELKEICRSLLINSKTSKSDMIMSIRFTASKMLKRDCIPRELETLFCALFGNDDGCLQYEFNFEPIIVTESGESNRSIKRRRLY